MNQEITIQGLERFSFWWALVGTLAAGLVGLGAAVHWLVLAMAVLLGVSLPDFAQWGYSYWFWEGLSVLAGALFVFGVGAVAVAALCVALGASHGGGGDPAERMSGGWGGPPMVALSHPWALSFVAVAYRGRGKAVGRAPGAARSAAVIY